MMTDDYGNKHIFGNQLLEKYDLSTMNIIDIREPFEIEICSVPGSSFIPMNTLLTNPNRFLKQEETYFILCHTGQRSYYVTDTLTKKGFNIVNIVGGIASIEEYNVPY